MKYSVVRPFSKLDLQYHEGYKDIIFKKMRHDIADALQNIPIQETVIGDKPDYKEFKLTCHVYTHEQIMNIMKYLNKQFYITGDTGYIEAIDMLNKY